jgi:hypothetical protein
MTSVAYEYVQRLYHSCENVQMGATGDTIMKVVFHASTPMEFIAYLGKKGDSSQSSPLQIDFQWASPYVMSSSYPTPPLYSYD